MSNNDNVTSNKYTGPGLLTLLTVLFVALKLISIEPVANWTWFWVLSPTLIPLIIFAVIIFIILALGLIVGLFTKDT